MTGNGVVTGNSMDASPRANVPGIRTSATVGITLCSANC